MNQKLHNSPTLINYWPVAQEISSKLINSSGLASTLAIKESLRNLAEATDSDQAHFLILSENKETFNLYEVYRSPKSNDENNLYDSAQALKVAEFMDDCFEYYLKNESLYYPDINKNIKRQSVFKTFMQSQAMQSLLDVPIFHNNELVAFIGLAKVERTGSYFKEEEALCKLIGNTIFSITQREQIITQQKFQGVQFKEMINHSKYPTCYIDWEEPLDIKQDKTQWFEQAINPTLKFCNKAYASLFGYEKPEDIFGLKVQQYSKGFDDRLYEQMDIIAKNNFLLNRMKVYIHLKNGSEVTTYQSAFPEFINGKLQALWVIVEPEI